MTDEKGIVPIEEGGALDYGSYAEDRQTIVIDKLPILHLVQNMSPEFEEGVADPGEVVIRIAEKGDPSNPNLGTKFQGIVVARGTQYVWWGDRDDPTNTGQPLARCIKGSPMPESYDINDTKWPNDGGNKREDGKGGPVADETHTFMVCPYKDGELGTPALLSYARGSKKTGDGLQILLNQFAGPTYAVLVEFFSHKTENSDGQKYYILKAKAAGALPVNSPLLPKLKEFYDVMQPQLAPGA